MSWKRRQSALTWSMAGIFLSVMLGGQAAHLRFPAAGQTGGGCSGCAAHAGNQHRIAEQAIDWSAGAIRHDSGPLHDHDLCVICQFFAASKAIALSMTALHPASPSLGDSALLSEQSVRAAPRAYTARGPPSPRVFA